MTTANPLTPAQAGAVASRGDVLVMAGAGTGKTKTLIARCIDCLERIDPTEKKQASLDELLIVTFTEAAAAELRERLRKALEEHAEARPHEAHWASQLALFDSALIGTLHSFCFRLVREHFYEAGLDPQVSLLDEGQARHLANETLEELFQEVFRGKDEESSRIHELIRVHANGRHEKIGKLILRIHAYAQTQPDPGAWFHSQLSMHEQNEPCQWKTWWLEAVHDWRTRFLARLQALDAKWQDYVHPLRATLDALPATLTRNEASAVLEKLMALVGAWPQRNTPRTALGSILEDAVFLASLGAKPAGMDPLEEDWSWVRGSVSTLLKLAVRFEKMYSAGKQAICALDFQDLEQTALRLLYDRGPGVPSSLARAWRKKLRFVFVDEYQDINAAQDRIISALSREHPQGNRFLVGDVKQSIYRFRLADPAIFRDYAATWKGERGSTLALSENFRSSGFILDFVNSLFQTVMHSSTGGVEYGPEAELHCGVEREQDFQAVPRVNLLLDVDEGENGADEAFSQELAELESSAREARLLARQFQVMVQEGRLVKDRDTGQERPVCYGDMAVLLRSPSNRTDFYIREFAKAGVPLDVAPRGFYENLEILDFLNLLRMLDNPLQDVPCLAVLRSPLVGLTLETLGNIRVEAPCDYFWEAVQAAIRKPGNWIGPEYAALAAFHEQYCRWRKVIREGSLSHCLEQIIAETGYDDWLATQPQRPNGSRNLDVLLRMARQFDQFQGHGLFRFLKFVESQEEVDAEPEAPQADGANSVRLLSIHQSKGLEFPVVAVACLDKRFNEQDLADEIILDEIYGPAAKVHPPAGGARYPSLVHWLARRRQARELRGEEMRLLYVALTRARDWLLLSARVSRSKWEKVWTQGGIPGQVQIETAGSHADWIGCWFARMNLGDAEAGGIQGFTWRKVDETDWTLPTAQSSARKDSPDARQETNGLCETRVLQEWQNLLDWRYPHFASTGLAAKTSVTDLRKASAGAFLDEEALQHGFGAGPISGESRLEKPGHGAGGLSGVEAGLAHHIFLQHVRISSSMNLDADAEWMVSKGLLSPMQRDALNMTALKKFWDSATGLQLRNLNPERIQRELPFTIRLGVTELTDLGITPADEHPVSNDDFIVVQGVADLAAFLPEGIWVLDFKTDRMTDLTLDEKIQTYQPQLQIYAIALQKIYQKPVIRRALYFLESGVEVELPVAAPGKSAPLGIP